MFGTNVEFSGLAERVDLLPVEPNPRGHLGRHLGKFRVNIGMCYPIHYHGSSFAGIWERIMREE